VTVNVFSFLTLPFSLSQLPKGLASEVYTTTFYIMFVCQSFLCALIPFFGSVVNIVVLSWLYSLYCFEYKWSSWTIAKRLKYVEDNWPYFAGFGLVVGCPFTLATVYLGFWIGYAVWFLLFPLVSFEIQSCDYLIVFIVYNYGNRIKRSPSSS
jgi:etoposide-induced 2.4 mRNA